MSNSKIFKNIYEIYKKSNSNCPIIVTNPSNYPECEYIGYEASRTALNEGTTYDSYILKQFSSITPDKIGNIIFGRPIINQSEYKKLSRNQQKEYEKKNHNGKYYVISNENHNVLNNKRRDIMSKKFIDAKEYEILTVAQKKYFTGFSYENKYRYIIGEIGNEYPDLKHIYINLIYKEQLNLGLHEYQNEIFSKDRISQEEYSSLRPNQQEKLYKFFNRKNRTITYLKIKN